MRPALILATLSAVLVANAANAAETLVRDRVQVFFDPDRGEAVRRVVRVVDPDPALGLEFEWTPAAAGTDTIGSDGLVTGEGRLVWYRKGAAAYDRKAVHSTYSGTLRAGLPEGRGLYRTSDGLRLEGTFRAGLLHGTGLRVQPDGVRYEGGFIDGEPEGEGRMIWPTGAVHAGHFAKGRPDGAGRLTRANGETFDSVWSGGVETGPRIAVAMSDKAGGRVSVQQASGGDAARMDMGFNLDMRLNGEAEMRYQQLVRDEDVAIYPEEAEINDAWNGTREINEADWIYTTVDYSDAPSFVELNLASNDGGKAKIETLKLEVATSETVLKPFLSIEAHRGCTGFRPDFNFLNFGWGKAENVKLNFVFADEEGSTHSSARTLDVGTFDEGVDVSVNDVLAAAGVDTNALATQRFRCASADELPACRAKVLRDVAFGDVAPTIWGEDRLTTTMSGTADYTWTDSNGQSWNVSEPFKVDIALARIEYPAELAECGGGFGGSPEAIRYIDLALPLDRKDYAIDIPVRGNKTLKAYTARLKMHADKTSYHSMRGVATFADGSVLQSKPLSFYFFKPREKAFTSGATPSACYLPDEADAC